MTIKVPGGLQQSSTVSSGGLKELGRYTGNQFLQSIFFVLFCESWLIGSTLRRLLCEDVAVEQRRGLSNSLLCLLSLLGALARLLRRSRSGGFASGFRLSFRAFGARAPGPS
jgi:hypothetical protein